MGLLPEIERRASVRRYTSAPIDPAALDRILEAGRRAPSAKNRQSWRFVVLTDHDLRLRVQEACFGQEYVGQAPAVIALCTTNIEYKMPNGQLSYPVDLSIAASFMMLQAVHEGLGSCLVTTFREDDVKSILTVPYSMRVVLLLTVGQPAADRPVEPSPRLPTERVISFNHW
ncbi:MAG: nitroreductase [Spirochaetaceae bacterium]|nr:MAG: nitroreductase [Spirochaetaceae bacterium]